MDITNTLASLLDQWNAGGRSFRWNSLSRVWSYPTTLCKPFPSLVSLNAAFWACHVNSATIRSTECSLILHGICTGVLLEMPKDLLELTIWAHTNCLPQWCYPFFFSRYWTNAKKLHTISELIGWLGASTNQGSGVATIDCHLLRTPHVTTINWVHPELIQLQSRWKQLEDPSQAQFGPCVF